MKFKSNFLKTAFDDFYGPGNTNISEYAGTKYTSRITPTSQNVYVHDCFFYYCSSSSDGGALYCSSSVYKLLVDQASFVSCRTSGYHGGAIFFNNPTNGECIVNKICGYNCSSTCSGTSIGQCVSTYTKRDATYKNHINDSAFTHTSRTSSGSQYVLCLCNGNISCPSINLTNNVCYCYTAVLYYPTAGSGSPVSETCCMSYSSIVNNTASGGHSCFYLDRTGSSHSIDSCNIINNKQTSTSYGTFYVYANVLIKDSCILGNNENYKVFYVNSGKITISNCTFDDDIFTNGRNYGSVTVIKTIEKTFIHALSHIATYHCDSYFDSYGTLTVKLNVTSENPRYLISCNNERPIIDALRNIRFLFLLTFLPSYPIISN
jgi:hypothetical protein